MSETTPEATHGGTVNLPGFGRVKSKTALMVGGGAVVLMLAYFYAKQRKAAQAATATSATSPNASPTVDPAGNTCDQSQINPATGYCTGSTQDLAAIQEQSALTTAAEGNIFTGQPFTGGLSQPAGSTGFFANNAEWAQAVYTALSSTGTDALAQAVAAYLAGQPVTTNQVGLIEEAIAVEGMPPVAGPNGMPPSINTSTGTGSGTTPPPPPPPPPPPKDTTNQTGTVHSDTTGLTGDVNTTNGGKTWNYVGVPHGKNDPANQTGTVHSNTTGLSGKVKTTDGGLHWTFVGA